MRTNRLASLSAPPNGMRSIGTVSAASMSAVSRFAGAGLTVAGLVVAASLLAGCGGDRSPSESGTGRSGAAAASSATAERVAPRSGGPHLLFIVSDTLRADAIDCDSARDRTPNLCDLADRGVYFEKSYAGGPWTLPSSVALFTGNHATSYGQLPPGSAADWSARDEFFHIGDDQVLLADALTAIGYRTLRFNEGKLPGEANAYQGLREPPVERRAALEEFRQAYPEASGWAGRLGLHDLGALRFLATRDDQSFYLLMWIINPHAPYSPAEPEQQRAAEGLGELRFPVPFYAELGHLNQPEKGHRLLREYAPYSPDELEMLVGLYHAEVRSVDERIGHFLEVLRARGIEDQTIVVVTSDHGEGFGEHDRFLHGNSFYEELLRVPLLMAGPGLPAGKKVTARVPSIDVMPTLCELMDAPCMEDVDGRSLLPLIAGEETDAERPLYVTAPMRQGLRDALIVGDYKLIVSTEGLELYDLAADPGELDDLADERPEVVEKMRLVLRDLRRGNEERRKLNVASLTDEDREETMKGTLEQMRALGYVE